MLFKINVLRNFVLFKRKGLQFYLKETSAQVFPGEYCEIFKNSIFNRAPLVVASEVYPMMFCKKDVLKNFARLT